MTSCRACGRVPGICWCCRCTHQGWQRVYVPGCPTPSHAGQYSDQAIGQMIGQQIGELLATKRRLGR